MHDNLKTVVVTGATKGIGLSIVEQFAKEYRVIAVSRSSSKEIRALGPNVVWMKCDITKNADRVNLVKKLTKGYKQIDVLVNGAGMSKWCSLDNMNERFIDDMLNVNLKSVLLMTKALLPNFAPKASVINVASLAGKRGSAQNSAYCAAKFGVVGVTQALAKELGVKGIRVNAVCPVYVQTPGLMKALKEKSSPTKGQSITKYLKDFANQQAALKRLPEANEVASLCFFLASNHASAITGQNINIDCGVLPQ